MAVLQPYGYVANPVSPNETVTYGTVGDYLDKVIVTVSTSATSSVTLADGATTRTIIPNNSTIGTYPIDIDSVSLNDGWSVSCNAGSSALMVGIFSTSTSLNNVWNDSLNWNDAEFWSDTV